MARPLEVAARRREISLEITAGGASEASMEEEEGRGGRRRQCAFQQPIT